MDEGHGEYAVLAVQEGRDSLFGSLDYFGLQVEKA